MEHEDEGLETVHESEAATIELAGLDANSGSGLEILDTEYFPTLDEIRELEYNQGKIPRPDYMKWPNVIEYKEIVEED